MAGSKAKKRSLPIERRFILRAIELAGVLGLDRGTIYRWLREGALLKPIELNGMRVWRRVEVEDWLAAGCPLAKHWIWKPSHRYTVEQLIAQGHRELSSMRQEKQAAEAELADLDGKLKRGRQAIEELHDLRRKTAAR